MAILLAAATPAAWLLFQKKVDTPEAVLLAGSGLLAILIVLVACLWRARWLLVRLLACAALLWRASLAVREHYELPGTWPQSLLGIPFDRLVLFAATGVLAIDVMWGLLAFARALSAKPPPWFVPFSPITGARRRPQRWHEGPLGVLYVRNDRHLTDKIIWLALESGRKTIAFRKLEPNEPPTAILSSPSLALSRLPLASACVRLTGDGPIPPRLKDDANPPADESCDDLKWAWFFNVDAKLAGNNQDASSETPGEATQDAAKLRVMSAFQEDDGLICKRFTEAAVRPAVLGLLVLVERERYPFDAMHGNGGLKCAVLCAQRHVDGQPVRGTCSRGLSWEDETDVGRLEIAEGKPPTAGIARIVFPKDIVLKNERELTLALDSPTICCLPNDRYLVFLPLL